MNEIRSLLKTARQRIEFGAFLRACHSVAIVVAAVAFALALADRTPGAPFVAWAWTGPALILVVLIIAAVLWSRRRPTELQVAVAVDDRLDLRERFSTALHCHGRDDAFALAAVDDAVTAARDPRCREVLRRRFAVTAPTRWWISPLIAMAVVGVLLLPQADLFADDDRPDEEAVERARSETRESLEVLVKSLRESPELNAELAGLVDELATPNLAAEPTKEPDQVKRNALKKITELSKRLDEIVAGEKGKTSRAMDQMLSKLNRPESGPAKELAEALARGDFQRAKQALQQMMDDAGNMSETQQEQLAQQLEQLAAQLDQLAQQQQALEQALQQAGLNPQLANNPQALQQALAQAPNLNQQQVQQLQQMAQAQQMAQQMMQGLGGACMQMAQGMKAGGQMGQGGQNAMNQLNQMEQLQMLLQQAQAAASQCQGQGIGRGMNMNQAMQQWMQGGAMGRWGQGRGGKASLSPTPTGTKLTKADTPVIDGEIIASMLIEGTPIRGESRAKLKQVVAELARGYEEGITEEQLPRQYHDAQKHFFGEMKRQIEAVTVEGDAEGAVAPEDGSSASGATRNAGGD